jgi:hypothetical protein
MKFAGPQPVALGTKRKVKNNMKKIEEIEEIMNTIPLGWRDRWCNGTCDGVCTGCAQIGNRIIMYEKLTGNKCTGDPGYIDESKIPKEIYNKYKITKEDWQLWMLIKEGEK